MVIPRLTERLDCMLYRRRLELEVAEVKPDVDMVRNAGAELRSSVKFKQVLSVSIQQSMRTNDSPITSRLY
jgi:diaphanous 1